MSFIKDIKIIITINSTGGDRAMLKNGALLKVFELTFENNIIPKFIIGSEIPNADELTAEQLKTVSKTSYGV